MLFDNIDIDKKYDFTLVLTRKNKTPIAILNEAYNRNLVRSIEDSDTLSFDVPYHVIDSETQEQMKNPNYDKIINEEMILLNCGDIKAPIFQGYFIIKKVSESLDGHSKRVECKSREIALNKNTVTLDGIERRIYDNEGTGVLNIFEQETSWKVGHVDASLLVDVLEFSTVPRYRWIDALSKPWLQFLLDEVQTAYNCIFMFDSYNKLINVYDRDNYGSHTGLIISEKNYLKNLEKSIQTESMVTKLTVTGQDGMTFEDVNIYGTDWITNYDYFKNNGQMSNELVSALDKYEALLTAKSVDFTNLRDQVNSVSSNLITAQSQLTTLKQELIGYLRVQSAYMSVNDNVNLPSATANVTNTQSLINNKQSQVNGFQTQLDSIYAQMSALAESIDKKNARDISTNQLIFNADTLEELEDFTYGESWESNFYPTSQLLLKAAKEQLADYSTPTIEFGVDLANLLKDVNGQMYWDKLNMGDFVRSYSTRLNTNIDLRIVGYSYNIDDNQLKIDFSNKNKKMQSSSSWGDVVRKSNESSKYLNVKRLSWDQIQGTKDSLNTYKNNALDVAKQNVISSQGRNKTTITENGVYVEDAYNHNDLLVLTAGQLVISDDGLATVKAVINKDGVVGDTIVGRIFLGSNLYIQNNNNTFMVDADGVDISNTINTFKLNNEEVLISNTANTFQLNNEGVTISNPINSFKLDNTGVFINNPSNTFKLDNDGVAIVNSINSFKVDNTGVFITNPNNTFKLDNESVKITNPINSYEFNKDGFILKDNQYKTLISPMGVANAFTVWSSDNLDEDNPINVRFRIDDGVNVIDQVLVYVSYSSFRAYEKSALGGGSYSKGSVSTSTGSGGGTVTEEDIFYRNTETATNTTSGSHYHAYSIDHTHNIPSHSHDFTIPAISIPNHTHPIEYGIFQGRVTQNTSIWIDGVLRVGGTIASNSYIDVTQWVSTKGFHTVSIHGDGLGRVSCGIYIKSYMGM